MKESLLAKIALFVLVDFILFPLAGIYFLLMRALGRITVVGSENIPKEGRIIFALSHLSMRETFLVPLAVFSNSFPASWLNPFKYVVWSFPDEDITRTLTFLPWCRCIPVKNKRKDLSALNKAVYILNGGGKIAVHPEGGRTLKGEEFVVWHRTGKKLRKLRDGIGAMVRRSKARVVPVWIETEPDVSSLNLFRFLNQLRDPVCIVVGRPLDMSSYLSLPDSRETWELIAKRIGREILVLTEQI